MMSIYESHKMVYSRKPSSCRNYPTFLGKRWNLKVYIRINQDFEIIYTSVLILDLIFEWRKEGNLMDDLVLPWKKFKYDFFAFHFP